MKRIISLNVLFAICASVSWASLGKFELESFHLEPSLVVQAQKGGVQFDLSSSYLGFEWMQDPLLLAQIKVGTSDLIRPHFLLTEEEEKDSLSLVEAYGEKSGRWGQFRAGLIPLALSYDAWFGEVQALDSQSLMLTQGLNPRRELGLEYSATHQGAGAQLAVIEGEKDEAFSKAYFTFAWSYVSQKGGGFLLSGVSGQVDNEDFRQGTLSAFYHAKKTDFVLDAFWAKTNSSSEIDRKYERLSVRHRFESMALTAIGEYLKDHQAHHRERRDSLLWSFFDEKKLSALDLSYRRYHETNEQFIGLSVSLGSQQVFPRH